MYEILSTVVLHTRSVSRTPILSVVNDFNRAILPCLWPPETVEESKEHGNHQSQYKHPNI
jgi:hypothetical protein